jgi:hypothetical protein
VLEKQFQLKSAAYVDMTSHNYRCDKLKSKPLYLQVNLDINLPRGKINNITQKIMHFYAITYHSKTYLKCR